MTADGSLPVRVYYEDTDAGGVVYYANYLRYAERARTEWLRACGVDLADWMKRGTVFVVAETNLKLRRPARYGDLLEVGTSLVSSGAATIHLAHVIQRDGEVLAENTVRLCTVDLDLKPVRLPAEIREALGL